jgi:hypothetical protein
MTDLNLEDPCFEFSSFYCLTYADFLYNKSSSDDCGGTQVHMKTKSYQDSLQCTPFEKCKLAKYLKFSYTFGKKDSNDLHHPIAMYHSIWSICGLERDQYSFLNIRDLNCYF